MKILVLNCGSSSVKFQFIDMTSETVLARGLVEKIGSTGALLRYVHGPEKEIREQAEVPNHEAAIALVLSTLLHPRDGVIRSLDEIEGVGHRLVHGGEEFADSVLVTPEVQEAIKRCSQFAPLHNPHNLKGIQVCERLIPGKLQAGVFDTAFHQKMGPEAFLYALPYGLYRKLGIRRYGFHGTSHMFVSQCAAAELGRPIEELRLITCHLGNGASIAAIRNGHSVDTTMGFTPLEGLVMGTRSGDLDPAVLPYLMQREGLTAAEVDSLLNKRSGMMGISEGSNDMREIIEAMDAGSEGHRLAFRIFCHRVRKYIGAYAAVLGGMDAVIFTGGIGENSHRVRAECLADLAFLGIELDLEANERNARDISRGRTRVLVIPTNEELAIARETRRVIEKTIRESAATLSEAEIEAELLPLTASDRRELVLIWAANPTLNPNLLQSQLAHKIHRKLSLPALQRLLELLGLTTKDKEAQGSSGATLAARG